MTLMLALVVPAFLLLVVSGGMLVAVPRLGYRIIGAVVLASALLLAVGGWSTLTSTKITFGMGQ